MLLKLNEYDNAVIAGLNSIKLLTPFWNKIDVIFRLLNNVLLKDLVNKILSP